jgi:putative restriction endonuclease
MNFYLGVTNNEWFDFLRQRNREDVNFWQPGGNLAFKRLSRWEPFLFKLKSPRNLIGGIAFFSSHSFLPLSMAWEVFGERNGCQSFQRFKKMILDNRIQKNNPNPTIGCIILTNPIFFDQKDWLPVPIDWALSIQQGKTYSTETEIGNGFWQRINILIQKYLYAAPVEEKKSTHFRRYRITTIRKISFNQSKIRTRRLQNFSN